MPGGLAPLAASLEENWETMIGVSIAPGLITLARILRSYIAGIDLHVDGGILEV